MFQHKTAVLALTLTVASGAPALAQGALGSEAHACFEQVADLAKLMAACQRVIGDGGAGTEVRAQAYLRRAYALAQRGVETGGKDGIGLALADLAEASRLAPADQALQKYVTEARTALQRPPEVAQPRVADADRKGADAMQVELLMQELSKAQERLAALEAAKGPAPHAAGAKATPRANPQQPPLAHALPPTAAEQQPPFALPPIVQSLALSPPVFIVSPRPRITMGSLAPPPGPQPTLRRDIAAVLGGIDVAPPPGLRPTLRPWRCTTDFCRMVDRRRHRLHAQQLSGSPAQRMRRFQHMRMASTGRAQQMRTASIRQAQHMRTASTRQARHMRMRSVQTMRFSRAFARRR